jgi:outer membrane protein, heavy metal efflux system
MAVEPRLARPAATTVAALALAGCASTFAGPDLERVRQLTSAPAFPDVAGREVEATADAEARRLLARPLDADTAVKVALLNNRTLRASLRQVGIARGQLVQAGLLPNPQVALEKPVEPEIRYQLGVELDLTHALLAPMRARAAAAALEAERYRAAGAVIDLGLEVRAGFYQAQAAEQRLALAQQSLEALAAAREAAQAMAQAGNTPRLGLASHEAAYERARVLVATIELEVATSREQLHRLLGLHGADTSFRLAGPLPPLPEQPPAVQRAETTAIERSLALAETRSRLEALARRSGVSRAEGWIPDVSVSASAAELSAEAGHNQGRRYGGGVLVGVPLFDRNQGATAALAAEFDALLERYHAAAVNVRSLARESEARLTSVSARARHYQAVIRPAQQRLTRETLLQFNAMQVGIFQLLLARREELDVELAYVDTLREYWTTRAQMQAVLQGGAGAAGAAAGSRSAGLTTSNPGAPEGGH